MQKRFLLIRGCANAVLAFATCAGATSSVAATEQIAGRVVRTDTGAPLAEVVVTLEALGPSPQCQRGEDRVAKSTADGSYSVPDVPPGCYFVIAYRTGFIGAVYGAPTPQQQGKVVTVTTGEKLGNIDFQLQPAPNVVEIEDDALVNGPELRLGLSFDRGRFSPDGQFFAFFVQANADINRLWRYDMRSRQLAPLGKHGFDLAWGGDALYVEDQDTHSNRGPFVEVVTPVGLKEVSQVPRGVARTFKIDASNEDSTISEQHNDRYTVISEYPCSGCGTSVKVRKKGETRQHLIVAGLGGGFLFDPTRSVLIYPKMGLSPALVTVDLSSGVSHTFQLPTPALDQLLDEIAQLDGYKVAFVAAGSCVPEETPDGQNPWILPNNLEYRRQHSFPRHICFVSLRDREKR